MGKLKIVDLFCGAGGWTQGLKEAGHEIIYAVDNWEDAVDTYRVNHGDHVELLDINDVSYDNSYLAEADVIVGSPPCKKFSQLNKKRDFDLSLTRKFLELVEGRNFVMENVALMKTVIEKELPYSKGRNYIVRFKDFGVPQHRTRFIKSNVLDVDGFRPDVNSDVKDYIHLFDQLDYKLPVHSERIKKKMAEVTPGTQHKDHKFGTYYRIPCSGVSQCVVNVVKSMMIHPIEDRRITVKEASLLQTFPLTYKFIGSDRSIGEQVGNAVSPKFAYYIGKYLWLWDEYGRPDIGSVLHKTISDSMENFKYA